MSQEDKKEESTLNKDAKEFIPTKNRVPQKLNFNLDAEAYKPKPPKEKIEYVEADDDDKDNPNLVCYVVVDQPNLEGEEQASASFATKIFHDIMKEVLTQNE